MADAATSCFVLLLVKWHIPSPRLNLHPRPLYESFIRATKTTEPIFLHSLKAQFQMKFGDFQQSFERKLPGVTAMKNQSASMSTPALKTP